VVDETIPLVAGTYEYDLPASFMFIYRVTMADSDGNFDTISPVPHDQYGVIHAATPKLQFKHFPSEMQHSDHYYSEYWIDANLTADRKLRVEGLASPATLTADTDTCPISPAFIVFQAAALLHGSRIEQPEGTYDAHRAQSDKWQERADIERARIVSTQLPPNSKRVRE